jgi:hypothetical protein
MMKISQLRIKKWEQLSVIVTIARRSNQNRGNRNKRGELTSQQYTRHRFIITGQISDVLSR